MAQDPHIEELLETGRKADKEDKERAELFTALVATKGWQLYVAMLTTMIEDRGGQILQPCGSVDGAIVMEFVKGTMNGLLLARDLPATTIGQMAQTPSEPEVHDDD